MRRLFIDAEPFERFWLRNAILIKALVFIEFVDHFVELFSINYSTDDVDCTPTRRFIEVAVIEHVTLFEVVSC